MRKPAKESELNTEPVGQNLIKLISNLCFSVFVFSVLIFTVIAITYQPPDPWLESAPTLTKLFTQTENATFKTDDSIVKTGEDLLSSPVPGMPPASAPDPVTETVIEKSEEKMEKSNERAMSPALAPNPVSKAVIDKSEEKIEKSNETAMSPALALDPATKAVIEKSEEKIEKSNETARSPALAPDSVAKAVIDKSEEKIEKSNETTMSPALAPDPVTQAVIGMSEEKTEKSKETAKSPALSPDLNTEVVRDKSEEKIEKSEETLKPPALAPIPNAEPVIEKAEEKISDSSLKSDCEELKVVNCSDPRVLLTVKRFNLKTFKSIVFFEYSTPVNGTKPNECDVAWKYRNKKEKSWRKYRDFRRFQFGFGENCTYKVMHTGRFHSGINARPVRSRLNTTRSGGGNRNPKLARPIRDDEINDTLPTLGSVTNFRKGRYLYYSRGGDHCKGMNQYVWSFLCGLGEAMYLNRTFVMDMNLCLSATYNPSNKNEEGKDFRFYFDLEHLKETASVVEKNEFLRDWKKWDKGHKWKVPVKKAKSYKVTPMQLKKDKSTIVWRQFDGPEPENYWYRVCEGQAAKYIHRPWYAIWKSKRLMNIVSEISGRMDWDFDALHVVRGEKARNKQLWPQLDSDTSPNSILTKLKEMVQPWRNLYIATNERFYNYFDNLRSYYKVHLLDDYKELWSSTSEWYNETTTLNGGKPVEFDGYMRVAVDTEVLYRAKTRVETFYNLTKDCKDGINTC